MFIYQATVKQLDHELQKEKNKNVSLQNEMNGERIAYQNELLAISNQIKQLKHIESLYAEEKKTCKQLQTQAGMKDQKIQALSQFMR